MNNTEKTALIALLRAQIRLTQALEPVREEIHRYYHVYAFNQEDLEECERIAQDLELD